LPDLAQLIADGHTSVKIVMSGAGFDRQGRDFLRVIRTAGKNGALSLIHCEDSSIITDATDALIAEGKSSARYLAESRPVLSEVVAVERVMAMCEYTGSPVYVVHLSSERALRVCQEARARGLRAYVETRPTYLFLTRERYSEPDPGLYVSWPPLRDQSDVDTIWRGLKEGAIQTLGSDHSAAPRSEKLDPALTLKNFRPGFSDLELMLPMFYSDGVVKGRISPERFAAVTATNAAKLFGLYPAKGTVAVGSDADLVLWDPAHKKIVRKAELPSRADFSVYEGREVTGWPRMTIRRGEIVFDSGKILGKPGSGKLLKRGPTQPLA
jgi:dihydropyrimidinase